MATLKGGYHTKDGERVPLWPMQINALRLRYLFLSKMKIDENTGCWLWQERLTAKGYGSFWLNGKSRRAHRWSYEHFVECQPDSLVIDHLCRNRHCVNPEHLEPVTQQINVLRGEARAAKQARQTHCIHGHPLAGNNLYRKPNGARQCIACRRVTDKMRKRDGH